MAKIAFDNLYFGATESDQSTNKEHHKKFISLLDKDEELLNFNGTILMQNNAEGNPKLYCLVSTDPSDKFNKVCSYLLNNYKEYLGDG